MRILQKVKQDFPHLSLKYLKKLIQDGRVKSSRRTYKLSDKVEGHFEVIIEEKYLVQSLKPNPDLKCDIVYEDKNLIILNKPAKLHSIAQNFLESNSVANYLLSLHPHLKNISSPLESGLINRLDYETSGLIMAAKTKTAYEYFREQMKSKKIIKHYQCLVNNGELQKSLHYAMVKPSSKSRTKVRLIPYDKILADDFEVIQTEILSSLRKGDHYLLTLRLITGFRHQIRAHLSDMEHPIVGDELYGGIAADRLFLHASLIRLTLPNGEKIEVESPPNF